jgi:serine/threonine-protein kinase PknG
MADQLTGVLREVLSAEDGIARPGRSLEFGPPRGTFGAGLLGTGTQTAGRPDPQRVATLLPVPLVDPADPAAGVLATASAGDPQEVLRLAAAAPDQTLELRLRVIRAHLEAGDAGAAVDAIDALAADEAGDWRLDWYRGVAALVGGDAAGAGPSFDTVLATLPGEPAPKLALAATAECAGLDEPAGRFYRQVGRPDPNIADAAFGAARVALRAGRTQDAIAALDTVPESSSQYVAAQLAAVRAAMLNTTTAPAEPDLRAAAARIEKLPLDPATDHDIRATVLTSALQRVPEGDVPAGPPLLGSPWSERGVRLALEERLRAAARLVTDSERRVALVDQANAVHPRTWV